MSRSALPAFGVAVALLASFGFAGCAAAPSGNGGHPAAGEPGDSAAGSGAMSSEEGGAPDVAPSSSGNAGLGDLIVDPGGDAGAPDMSCAADVSLAEVVPLDMYIMLDVSGSMLQETAMYDRTGTAITKWSAIKTALKGFIQDESSNGIGVGIQYFPVLKPSAPTVCSTNADCGDSAPCALSLCYGTGDVCQTQSDCPGSALFNPCLRLGRCGVEEFLCAGAGNCEDDFGNDIGPCVPISTSWCTHTAKCDTASYTTPAEAIAPLPGSASALIASLDAQLPIENTPTPTGPALNGALKQATAWAKAHPDHRVVAVLATDGAPSECTPLAIADVGQLAADGLAATPSIPTFAIGVFTSASVAQGKVTLDTIAKAGGTKAAFVVDTSTDVALQFHEALDAIRSTQLACEFQIPQPKKGENIDYSLVNVGYKSGKKSATIYYVGSSAKCDALSGGWYYDSDPKTTDPTRIKVCPTTCTTISSAQEGSISIAVGCETIVK